MQALPRHTCNDCRLGLLFLATSWCMCVLRWPAGTAFRSLRPPSQGLQKEALVLHVPYFTCNGCALQEVLFILGANLSQIEESWDSGRLRSSGLSAQHVASLVSSDFRSTMCTWSRDPGVCCLSGNPPWQAGFCGEYLDGISRVAETLVSLAVPPSPIF